MGQMARRVDGAVAVTLSCCPNPQIYLKSIAKMPHETRFLT